MHINSRQERNFSAEALNLVSGFRSSMTPSRHMSVPVFLYLERRFRAVVRFSKAVLIYKKVKNYSSVEIRNGRTKILPQTSLPRREPDAS